VAGIGRQRAREGDCGSRTGYATWPTSGARKWVARLTWNGVHLEIFWLLRT